MIEIDILQKTHDLTVALVAATAKEHTAESYVKLYRALYAEVYAEVKRESEEYAKAHPRFLDPNKAQ